MDLRRAVGVKLSTVSRRIARRFDQCVEQLGLSYAKFRVIALAANRPGATQRIIAEALEITAATAGRLIERLCVDGYLERRESPEDRRAHRVYLTDAGRAVLDQLRDLATAQEAETFAGLTEADLAALETLLRSVAANLARLRIRPPADFVQADGEARSTAELGVGGRPGPGSSC